MIDRAKLIASFEEIVGWPYESPGTNDRNGIDCSGAFVRAFRAQGGNIYHGSNRIIRAHCRDVFRITDEAQLVPGMPVFKIRQDGGEPAEYKPGGRYYDPAIVGNVYHIGLVCAVSPLRIIHATTPAAKVDTTLGTWALAGYLDDVPYGASVDPISVPEQATATVLADGGLRLRKTPGGEYMMMIPQGAVVPVLATETVGGILYVRTSAANDNGTHIGWVAAGDSGGKSYLQMDAVSTPDAPSGTEGGSTESSVITVSLPRDAAESVLEALQAALS